MSYVPVVDISADPDAAGAELDEICRAAGFFQVTRHGVPAEVAERAWRATRKTGPVRYRPARSRR